MAALLAAAVLWMAAVAPAALANCNGFNVTAVQLVPCRNSSAANVLRLTNVTATLREQNGKCELVPKGCVEVVKSFTTTNITYMVSKDSGNTYFKRSVVGCSANATVAMVRLVKALLVSKCSAQSGTVCQREPVDFTNQTQIFQPATGFWKGTVWTKHDSGSSCFRLVVRISKKSAVKPRNKAGK